MSEEVAYAALALLTGQGGAGVIVGMVMGIIKNLWKPKQKALYWIPAVILSYLASLAVMLTVGWNWWGFLGGGVIVASVQITAENEAWPGFKKIVTSLVDVVKTTVFRQKDD